MAEDKQNDKLFISTGNSPLTRRKKRSSVIDSASESNGLKPQKDNKAVSKKNKTASILTTEQSNAMSQNKMLEMLKKTQQNSSMSVNNKKIALAAQKWLPSFNKIVDSIDYAIKYITQSRQVEGRSDIAQYTRGPAIFGVWVTIFILSVFMIWGVWAPLNSAASVEGQLVLESKKRVIQHPTGGVIKRIYVKNGDVVEKGDILLSLDKSKVQASLDTLHARITNAEAENARLVAQRDNNNKINFPESIIKLAGKPQIAKIIRVQEELFTSKVRVAKANAAIFEKRIKQAKAQKDAYEAQSVLVNSRIDALQKRVNRYASLAAKGGYSKDQLASLQDQLANLQGEKSGIIGRIATSEETIYENQLQVERTKSEYLTETEKELRENQQRISEIKAQLIDIENEYRRLEIVAPVDGVVSNLIQRTEGGTLTHQQEPILEIVPQDDKLVFDARVKPQDIDVVRVGQHASVKLTPFKARVVPAIEGKIVSLSADIIPPRIQGDYPHYIARIEINKKSLDEISKLNGIELYPGMPGQGLIIIGSRTLLKYLFDPITMSFSKAFIEQ